MARSMISDHAEAACESRLCRQMKRCSPGGEANTSSFSGDIRGRSSQAVKLRMESSEAPSHAAQTKGCTASAYRSEGACSELELQRLNELKVRNADVSGHLRNLV